MELSQMAVNAANQLLNRGISIDNYQNYAIPQKDSFYLCVENPENPFYANATIQWNSDQVRPVVNPYVRRETVSQNSLVLVVPPDGMTELEFERCKK